MATSAAVPGKPQNSPKITIPGVSGLELGNPSTPQTFVPTEDTAKIVPDAPANDTNNSMIAGSNNTINGEESSAAKGAKKSGTGAPPNQFNAGLNKGKQQCTSAMTTPIIYWDGGFGVMPGCGCYVSTGIDLITVATLLFSGGALGAAWKGLPAIWKSRAVQKKSAGLFNYFKGLREAAKNGDFSGIDGMIREAWHTVMGNERVKLDYLGFPDFTTDQIERYRAKMLKELKAKVRKHDARRKGLNVTDFESAMIGIMVFLGLSGAASLIVELATGGLTIYRPKKCEAENRSRLGSQTCKCLCDDENMTDDCYTPSIIPSLTGLISPLFYSLPIASADFDEVNGCDDPCPCLSERETDLFGNLLCTCECDPPDLPYGNGPCHHGRNFDSDTCCCDCPEGSHLAEGLSPSGQTYARLDDNLGTVAPSAYHESYSTGCNYVCDGREADSSNMISPWPPACPYGYFFSTDPLQCRCVDICSTGVCRWIVECYGCGNIDDCTDEQGNSVPCQYEETYFTSEEYATEAEAQAFIDNNGGGGTCAVRVVLEGTSTASGSYGDCS